MINGVLPVLVLGIGAPVGLVAFCLALKGKGAPIAVAVSHGELLLGAGNAALVGAFTYLAARPDKNAVNGTIGAIVYIVLGGMPNYVGWAYVTVAGIDRSGYSHGAATTYGLIAAGVTGLVSLWFVSETFRPPLPSG
jgi:hypothetical protein